MVRIEVPPQAGNAHDARHTRSKNLGIMMLMRCNKWTVSADYH